MSASSLKALVDEIRAEANLLRAWGADAQACAAEHAADRIEGHLAEWELETLSISVAAAESGYSESHLRRLISEGRIADVGNGRGVRIRRCDLPRKPRPPSPPDGEPDLAGTVLRARGLDLPGDP